MLRRICKLPVVHSGVQPQCISPLRKLLQGTTSTKKSLFLTKYQLIMAAPAHCVLCECCRAGQGYVLLVGCGFLFVSPKKYTDLKYFFWTFCISFYGSCLFRSWQLLWGEHNNNLNQKINLQLANVKGSIADLQEQGIYHWNWRGSYWDHILNASTVRFYSGKWRFNTYMFFFF